MTQQLYNRFPWARREKFWDCLHKQGKEIGKLAYAKRKRHSFNACAELIQGKEKEEKEEKREEEEEREEEERTELLSLEFDSGGANLLPPIRAAPRLLYIGALILNPSVIPASQNTALHKALSTC